MAADWESAGVAESAGLLVHVPVGNWDSLMAVMLDGW